MLFSVNTKPQIKKITITVDHNVRIPFTPCQYVLKDFSFTRLGAQTLWKKWAMKVKNNTSRRRSRSIPTQTRTSSDENSSVLENERNCEVEIQCGGTSRTQHDGFQHVHNADVDEQKRFHSLRRSSVRKHIVKPTVKQKSSDYPSHPQ